MNKWLLAFAGVIFVSTSQAKSDTAAIHAKELFNFHNDARHNFHQYIYRCANSEKILNSEICRDGKLSFSEQVNMYQKHGADNPRHHVLFSTNDIAALTELLIERSSGLPKSDLNTSFLSGFNEYESSVWRQHQLANQQWIEALLPKLERYGNPLMQELAKVFQLDINTLSPVNVDVTLLATSRGAFTSGRNRHITITSTSADYQDWAALEMIFHEFSHIHGVSRHDPMSRAINTEFNRLGITEHRQLWHVVMFYTVGEITKKTIADETPNYVPYGIKNNLYSRSWDIYLPLLKTHWQPYLDDETTMQEALRALIQDLAPSQTQHINSD